MEATTKKKLVIGTSVAVILGVGGYFLYKFLKEKGVIGGKVKEDVQEEETVIDAPSNSSNSSNSSKPTTAQKELATAYRIWANSTDTLKKKYGKDSSYDLDATSNTPYNSYFTKSYAAGKTEYEKAAKAAVESQNDQVAQISAIAARYKRPITILPKGGMSVEFSFSGKTNGVTQYYKLLISEKSSTDNKKYKGSLVWKLSAAPTFITIAMETKAGGLLTYRNKKYSGSTNYGIGIGAKVSNQGFLGTSIEKLSSNQIKITNYGSLKV
jgi:hypothetical protein